MQKIVNYCEENTKCSTRANEVSKCADEARDNFSAYLQRTVAKSIRKTDPYIWNLAVRKIFEENVESNLADIKDIPIYNEISEKDHMNYTYLYNKITYKNRELERLKKIDFKDYQCPTFLKTEVEELVNKDVSTEMSGHDKYYVYILQTCRERYKRNDEFCTFLEDYISLLQVYSLDTEENRKGVLEAFVL